MKNLRNEEGEFMSRKEFFAKSAGIYKIPGTTKNFNEAEGRLVEMENWKLEKLPIIEKAFRNAQEIYQSGFCPDCEISEAGKVSSCYRSLSEIVAELEKRLDSQRAFVREALDLAL